MYSPLFWPNYGTCQLNQSGGTLSNMFVALSYCIYENNKSGIKNHKANPSTSVSATTSSKSGREAVMQHA